MTQCPGKPSLEDRMGNTSSQRSGAVEEEARSTNRSPADLAPSAPSFPLHSGLCWQLQASFPAPEQPLRRTPAPCVDAQEMPRHKFRPPLPLRAIDTRIQQIKQQHSTGCWTPLSAFSLSQELPQKRFYISRLLERNLSTALSLPNLISSWSSQLT